MCYLCAEFLCLVSCCPILPYQFLATINCLWLAPEVALLSCWLFFEGQMQSFFEIIGLSKDEI